MFLHYLFTVIPLTIIGVLVQIEEFVFSII